MSGEFVLGCDDDRESVSPQNTGTQKWSKCLLRPTNYRWVRGPFDSFGVRLTRSG